MIAVKIGDSYGNVGHHDVNIVFPVVVQLSFNRENVYANNVELRHRHNSLFSS